jgi:hypothetical protein
MSTRAGHAAHATMRWLHGRPVRGVSLQRPIDHAEDPAPRDREGAEEAIRLALAAGAGEMIHLGAEATHLSADRHDVQAAMRHAASLPGDPVDHLERELDSVLATLRSPRVWHAVQRLAAALGEHRQLDGATSAALIKSAILSGAGANIEPHPRTVRLVRGLRSRGQHALTDYRGSQPGGSWSGMMAIP